MSGAIFNKDARAGSANVTGYLDGKKVTIPTIGQTTDPRVFEANPEIFNGIKHRLHLPWYTQSFRLQGEDKEKPVTIRVMRPPKRGLARLFR